MKNKTTIYFKKIDTDKIAGFHNMTRNAIRNWGLCDGAINMQIMKQFYLTQCTENSEIANKIRKEAKEIKTTFSSIPEELICDFIILARFVFNNDINFEKTIGIYPIFDNSNRINSYALVVEADEQLNVFGVHSRLDALHKFAVNGCSAVYAENTYARRSVYDENKKKFIVVSMPMLDAIDVLSKLMSTHSYDVNQALNKDTDMIALITGESIKKREV